MVMILEDLNVPDKLEKFQSYIIYAIWGLEFPLQAASLFHFQPNIKINYQMWE